VALTANVLKDKKEYFNKGMDEALSKPLSAKALKKVLARVNIGEVGVQLAQPDENDEPSINKATSVVDVEMLSSYIEIVGKKQVLEGVAVFEQLMPDYASILQSNLIAKDQDAIVSEAHKIKGAAGSVGLKRIQSVAQKAQSPELPAWWENIDEWVDEIRKSYQSDVEILKQWVEHA
jgi:two-component system aerobic respiration control sensor histidine kinase ArcB